MKEVAESLKYNAVTQLLAIQNIDPYKGYKVSNSVALEEMNRLLALAQTLPKTKAEQFFQSLKKLSQGYPRAGNHQYLWRGCRILLCS
jgi:hypothetical protein